VTEDACPAAVGLLFAGSSDGSTIANPIGDVLSGLGVTMVGSCGASPATAGASVNTAGASTDTAAALPTTSAASRSANVGIAQEAIASASAIRSKHSVELMRIPGAVGTGIGIGDHSGQPAIEVYVSKITPEAQAATPTSVDGVTVRLVETGDFVAY